MDHEENRIREVYNRRAAQAQENNLEATRFAVQNCSAAVRSLLKEWGMTDLSDKKVLDVGCGHGTWLRRYNEWGAMRSNLCGLDLMPDRIERARLGLGPDFNLVIASAGRLPYPKETFHLVSQFTMFSSVLDSAMRQMIASEMIRVLKPAGLIIWYDLRMNNPGNPDVRGINRKEIERLFRYLHCRL
jgi:ubiquinone/menaquinone biosynthesis C-methylase UbiE